ncbi:MBL fold metallo-hydrolase [bacterium]|nr:MBL fold metallo-hydrolase [bacterium]
MKKSAFITSIILMVLLIIGCGARVDKAQTGLVKLNEKVYAYIAAGPSFENSLGANAGFVVGTKGVLVVDSRYTTKQAGELLKAIRTVTDHPIRYLVNTHYHPVNVWGNSVFKKEGAVIFARPETIRDIKKYSPAYINYYKDNNPEKYKELQDIQIVLPDSTMGDRLTLDLGSTVVILNYFGPAHTEGDCIVSIDDGEIIFTGGILSKGYHPNLGDPGADFDNWLKVLERLKKMNPEYLVPGEGKICEKEDIELEREYIVTLRNMCREKIRKDASVDDAVSSITAKGVMPGSENYYHKNILTFNIQALFQHEVISTVNPDFTFIFPPDFRVGSGGGNRSAGRIFWGRQTEDGYEEIEVQWQPTSLKQIIMQDIYDRVGSFKCTSQERELKLKEKKEILIGEKLVKAAQGAWFHETRTVSLRGQWTMAMILERGKLYTILCAVTAGGKTGIEEENIKRLEEIASTFRVISGVKTGQAR